MNNAIGSEHCSVVHGPARAGRLTDCWPVVRRVTIKFQEKYRSMARDVITIVVLFVCVQTVRSNHIKGSVSTECFKMIPDIDTGIGCRRVCVRIALRFYRYRRQCEQLIVAVIDVLCRVTLRFSAPSVAMIFGKRSRIFSISVPSNSCARSALAIQSIGSPVCPGGISGTPVCFYPLRHS